MKKHIVLAAGMLLAAALLTACPEQADTESTAISSSGVTWEQTESNQAANEEGEETESQTHPSSTGTEESSQSESEPQKDIATVQTQPEESAESTARQEKESQIAEQTVSEAPTESPPSGATVPQTEPATEPTAELPTEPESETVVTEPETDTEPTEELPTEPETDTEPTEAESYDIEAHLIFARSYAESIGLILDSTAVDCWDNPISANLNLTNVDENITSRLNRYKNVEGFTAVWIWAVQVSENGYAIYIGYA